ncbi:SMI1/KNR4 family protein [Pseudomonas sp. NPDC087346]|uniref:SMI1/KNR4 family protein n=1 Tax=Pseudomonas sp. NPDC087346 TaxID=3364438 RepID=UPI00382712D4
MHKYKDLIKALEHSSNDTFWNGPSSADQIEKLETILDLQFPKDFRDFLAACGGGGAVDSEICGIENNDAILDSGGTINYSTHYCRSNFCLPKPMAVIYFKDDEVCWVIDCSPCGGGKILTYDLFKNKLSKIIADNFHSFFKEYVELRSHNTTPN